MEHIQHSTYQLLHHMKEPPSPSLPKTLIGLRLTRSPLSYTAVNNKRLKLTQCCIAYIALDVQWIGRCGGVTSKVLCLLWKYWYMNNNMLAIPRDRTRMPTHNRKTFLRGHFFQFVLYKLFYFPPVTYMYIYQPLYIKATEYLYTYSFTVFPWVVTHARIVPHAQIVNHVPEWLKE